MDGDDEPLVGELGRLYEATRSGRFVPLCREPVDLSGWPERVTRATPADQDHPLALVRPRPVRHAGDRGQ